MRGPRLQQRPHSTEPPPCTRCCVTSGWSLLLSEPLRLIPASPGSWQKVFTEGQLQAKPSPGREAPQAQAPSPLLVCTLRLGMEPPSPSQDAAGLGLQSGAAKVPDPP